MASVSATNVNINAAAYAEVNLQQNLPQNTTIETTQQVSFEASSVTLREGVATKRGIDTTAAEVRIAQAGNNQNVNDVVSNIIESPNALNDLTNALSGKSADYQARVINRLVQQSPETAARIFSAAGESNNRVVGQALSNAYNSHGDNGGSFLYNIIKNGITGSNFSATQAQNISSLIVRSGNTDMMRDFADKSLIYSNQLATKHSDSPAALRDATSLRNATLNLLSTSKELLAEFSGAGRLTDAVFRDSITSGSDAAARVLDTASKNRFGTNLFFSAANSAGGNDAVDSALTRYIEQNGVAVLDAATDNHGNNRTEQASLKNYISRVALESQASTDKFMENVFGKILANSQNRVSKFAATPAGIADPDNNTKAGSEAKRIGTLINLIEDAGGSIKATKEAISGWLSTTMDFLGGELENIPGLKNIPGVGRIGNAFGTFGAKAVEDFVNSLTPNTDGLYDVKSALQGIEVVQDNIIRRIEAQGNLTQEQKAALNSVRQHLDEFGDEVAAYINEN